MSITFSCPHCQSRMSVPDSLGGKRGKCSKCKNVVVVPAADTNGEAAPAPRPTSAAPRAAAPPRPAPPPVPGKRPPPPPVNVEDEAAALLADEPAEEEKQAELVEFNCPQCDEPVKLALELAGKRHPCPHCRKIIPVPVPQTKKADWRDTGPKLPAGARRDEGPAPEGAWGTASKTAVGAEALKEAGVIKEKAKPKTFLQKVAPFALVLVPLLLIGGGALTYRNWRASTREKRALAGALDFAKSDKGLKALGADGQAALSAQAGRYYLHHPKSDAAASAREHLSKAIAQAQGLKSPAREELLIDVVGLLLELGGEREPVEDGTRLKWDEVQKLLVSAIAIMSAPEAQRDALRLACSGLASKGQAARVLPLTTQAVRGDGLPQHEAIAVAGLELLRHGHTEDAKRAAAEAERPYAAKKDRPRLRRGVVALSTALGRDIPNVAKNKLAKNEREAYGIGSAEGHARRGKVSDARSALSDQLDDRRDQLRGRIAMAAGAIETKVPDAQALVNEAIGYLKSSVPNRTGLDWELLRLIEAGLAAGLAPEAVEPVLTFFPENEPDQPTPPVARARLLILRERLKRSTQVEPATLAEPVPADTMAGKLARLELARHNTRQDRAWADTIKDWPEGLQAFGSLGVAMGLQREK